nr:ATPase phospholipid transporting 8B3 [Rousettus aegyptiacus]
MVSKPSALLVVLLNVSLNTLPVLAFRIIYQALKKPHLKVTEAEVPTDQSWNPSLCREQEEESEEAPSQDVITVDTQPYLHRGSRSRRSSYAFSHREGYADLITQGTSLQKSPVDTGDLLADHRFLPDEELVLNITKSPWYRRKMSFLGRAPQLQEKVSSEDETPSSSTSSYLTTEERTSCTNRAAPPPERGLRGVPEEAAGEAGAAVPS